jgi:hypothetical protein
MSGRRALSVAAIAATAALAIPAVAGSGLPDRLREANAATEAAATMRAEIDEISKGAGDARTEARIAFRRVAFDLLYRGDASADGQASVMAGFRLAWLRSDVDALLQATPADPARAATLLEAAAAFAKSAGHGVDRVPPPDRPEEALRELLAPLDRAIAAAEEAGTADPGTAWPAADDLRQPQATAAWAQDVAPGQPPADDAGRVAAIPSWVAAVKGCNPRAGSQFESSAKAWTAALRDRARQAGARASMDAFATELPLAQPSALERAVRAGDAAARAACAGRPDDLLSELERRRSAWALGWANGRGSPAAGAALRQGLGVALALAQASQVATPAADSASERPHALGAWGGAAVAPGGWRTHPRALTARAALALEALLEAKADATDRELAVLGRDLPIARLERTAKDRLARWLPSREGLRARLRAAADGPAADAWLGAARADLMLASRLLVEEVRARAMREDALATELRSRAAEAAARALGAARLPG